ncbi:hypothetical protein BJ170DRAFT_618107 [Xylariales sp. AK1849]|nr:hypothetical protein BJ170DRAFT_618107 [Xylariales sp. AK1849]
MPWQFHPPSPPASPPSKPRAASSATIPAMTMSYILALMDGATGTIPLTHRCPVAFLLKADARLFLRALPQMMLSSTTHLVNRRKAMSWKGFYGTALYLLLSLVEVVLALTAVPIWLMLPGFAALPWLGAHIVVICCLVHIINRESKVFAYDSDETGDGREEDRECFTWTVVAGMEWNEDHFHKQTIPKLARLFGHDMHIFLPYRLGLPLDYLVLFLQRSLQLSTPLSTALYSHLRAHCVRSRAKQMNIIVHNTGALDIAWVLSRICCDLPPGQRLGKFHLYTFGAVTAEMTMPLRSQNGHGGHSCSCDDFPQYPLINHYAFEDDPFAQIGVLLGARQRMEGRLVGAVYAIQNHRVGRRRSLLPEGPTCSLDDYLDALFPGGNPRAGVLGQVCRIEREICEMREMSALTNAVYEQARKGKRRSWTALGTLADSPSSFRGDINLMAGVVSVDEARRTGKSAEGMLGYENNTLAGYVLGKRRLTRDEQRGITRNSALIPPPFGIVE